MTKTIKEIQMEAHAIAIKKGWWDGFSLQGRTGRQIETRDVMSFLANAHGEISEANEEVRRLPVEQLSAVYYEGGKPCGFGIELADTIIRLLDTAAALGIDMDRMIELKQAFNATRPLRHGGKLA